MSTSPTVVVDSLVVHRGRREVLHGLDLTFAAGTVTGLLGPSGGGKTTLLRAILGVQIVTSGTVTVLGEPVGSAGLRRRIGYVTQAPSVYEDLTVEENLRYFARILGVPDAATPLERVDLTPVRHQLVGQLSGGQRSRVGLATALLGSPELLVLDEPTVGLDPVLRASLWGLFAELASSGVGLIVSSHVMDEATRCDEVVLLREGAVVVQSSPTELLAQTGTTTAEAAFLALVGGAVAP
ncbi:ABC-2 type transport system ATP-binding protein [Sanguibacter gelidistatuariae]|uniref:ABC-2 type transport system ATP-binding protein n=1 Tax=Sanguibacter gelidistatuariae TaxID=1814289 RepID=A0A1G6Y0P5_9MICO|nr:ABC transporter ATP-binding protein [Sanguibacter gelidistatuariae]SDD83841.1 ABC-2 type transport system ATP-binding protein [Sanguibacter gelidistatuariae]